MKKPILYIVLLLSTNFLFAQGSITFNPDVPNVTDGIVDFTFDLVGGGAEYDLSVEVSFNNGTDWNDIDPSHITGLLENVTPTASIALQWDAMASFPGQVTNETRLRVTARHVCETAFTFTYPAGGTETVTYGTVVRGGLCWFDRNLGASQVAIASDDLLAYGDLFQWGRGDDEHQDRTSTTTSTLSTTDVPGHGDFITNEDTETNQDWKTDATQNNNLWQGESGINNPCPSGWRVPTEAELNAERLSWEPDNSTGAFASDLKWPVGGYRLINGVPDDGVGSVGFVWSSSVSNDLARFLGFGDFGDFGDGDDTTMSNSRRANGLSVRCVRD